MTKFDSIRGRAGYWRAEGGRRYGDLVKNTREVDLTEAKATTKPSDRSGRGTVHLTELKVTSSALLVRGRGI